MSEVPRRGQVRRGAGGTFVVLGIVFIIAGPRPGPLLEPVFRLVDVLIGEGLLMGLSIGVPLIIIGNRLLRG